eukprot:1016040-Pleurochrysis_carterae.AAC.1
MFKTKPLPIDAAHAFAQVSVKWFERKERVRHARFAWSTTPTFVPAKDPNSGRPPWKSSESLKDFLPVLLALTSTQSSSARRNLRITAACARLLAELCKQRNLIRDESA